jgi:small subunit ribosomal protein S15
MSATLVSREVKKNLFKEHGGKESNTGSTAAQIALFTARINHITSHLDTNKKDHSGTRSLLMLVGKRRRLLNYLMKEDLAAYRQLIDKLNIRK